MNGLDSYEQKKGTTLSDDPLVLRNVNYLTHPQVSRRLTSPSLSKREGRRPLADVGVS